MNVHIKRIYDNPEAADGYRILVDRLWPRGVSKVNAQLDAWMKDIAPSPELRTWFDHRADRFAEFSARYEDELHRNTEAVGQLQTIMAENSAVTLLYAAHDPEINHARVLLEYLQQIDHKKA